MIHIVPARASADIAVATELFKEYARSLPVDLEYQGFSAELKSLPGVYQPPTGALFVARVDGEPAGCVAVRHFRDRICEMKRLYVRPTHRGSGIGPLLVAETVAAARKMGYEEIWLDTLASMTAAHKLYVSLGFHQIPSYGSNVMPGTQYYGLRVSTDPQVSGP